jgi:hypothetical protein
MANPAYTKPEGWSESPFWETYALNFANDGSDDQLAAVLSHSVPQSFLDSYKSSLPGVNGGSVNPYWDALMDAKKKGGGKVGADFTQKSQELSTGDTSGFVNRYSQALQKRLADDFNKNQQSYLERGRANLRGQSQQALNDDFSTIDENMSARGLLRSGKRAAAKAAAAAQRAGDLGAATTQFEQGLADEGRAVNNASYSSDINSLLQQQDLNSIASGAFYNKLQNDLTGTAGMIQGLGSLGQGLGSFGGSLAGMRKAAGKTGGNSGSNVMGQY